MTRRRKPDKKQRRVSLSLKQWKSTAIAAIAVAVAALVALIVVLAIGVPGDSEAPGSRVLAVVNSEDVTAHDVARMQAMIQQQYGREVNREEALERAISERLLYRKAERGNYAPSIEQAEQLLLPQIAASGITIEQFRQQLQQRDLSWEDYLVYYQSLIAIERYLDATLEVPEPTEEQIREFYDEYKRLSPDDTRPFEEVEADVLRSVEWLNRERVVHEHIADLREQADIEYR